MLCRHVLGLAALILVGCTSSPDAPPAAASSPAKAGAMLSPEAVRADLRQLYETLQRAHYDLYARTSRADYERLYRSTQQSIRAPEPPLQVTLKLQRFVAHGRIAHARIDDLGTAFETYRQGGGTAFPLSIRVVDDRVYVVRNGSGLDAIAVGDEILALNGKPMREWLPRLHRNLSADSPYMANGFLEWRMPSLLWLELGNVPAFDLRLRKNDGRESDVSVPARTRADTDAALANQPKLLDLSWEAREARMLEGKFAYLRPGPFYNPTSPESMYDNREFRTFIDGAFESFLAAGATSLLIDLRDNPGGDNSFSDHMVAWFATRPFKFSSSSRIKVSPETVASNARRLSVPGNDPTGGSARMAEAFAAARMGEIIESPIPLTAPREGQRFTGKVYLLVNRHSYSNTVMVAALVQDYGFGSIIGEETSDLATTYGAMETFTLANSGLEVGYPKALIIRPSGSLEPRGVVPSIPIKTPVIETPNDPVLQEAVGIVRSGG